MAQNKSTGSNTGFVTSIVVVVVLLIIFLVGYSLYSNRDTSGRAGEVPRNATDTYYLAWGSADAEHTLKVFEDFQCPVCQVFEQAAGATLEQAVADGKVRVLFHPMAFLDRYSSTRYSSRASNAFAVVLDASGPDVAKKFHDLLFVNQPPEGSAGLPDSELISLAVQAGAKESDVASGINDEFYEQWVVNATDNASKAEGVTGTPTIKLDGKVVEYTSFEDLLSKLDVALGLATS